MSENRRQYSRVSFQTEARLILDVGPDLAVHVEDLSLKGALVRLDNPEYIHLGSHGRLVVALDNDEATIQMAVTVVHRQQAHIGLACREIDLESVTHLRRLVAFNLGSEQLLERELSHFSGR